MKFEKYITEGTQYSVNVAGGTCEALRVKEDKKTVVRAFDGEHIGISATIGDGDERALKAAAENKLAEGIAYPCALPSGSVRSEDVRTPLFPSHEIVRRAKSLLAKLQSEYPDFIFSDKILTLEEKLRSYENSEGTRYFHAANAVQVMCVIKAKSSANIMDASYDAYRNCYDEEAVVSDVGKILNPYNTVLKLPEESVPVIIDKSVFYYACSELIGDMYASGASLFSGKLGEKIFDGRLNLYADYAPANGQGAPFFDSEGTTAEGDAFYFIKNGVLRGLATTRRSSRNYALPLSGGAHSEFDGVPAPAFMGIECGLTAPSLRELVKGKAIYVSCTSGGDMTRDGMLGLPVQLAYLYEDGKLAGRLPEFTIGGNIFDIFGKDFVGIAVNDVFSFRKERVIVAKFAVNR